MRASLSWGGPALTILSWTQFLSWKLHCVVLMRTISGVWKTHWPASQIWGQPSQAWARLDLQGSWKSFCQKNKHWKNYHRTFLNQQICHGDSNLSLQIADFLSSEYNFFKLLLKVINRIISLTQADLTVVNCKSYRWLLTSLNWKHCSFRIICRDGRDTVVLTSFDR